MLLPLALSLIIATPPIMSLETSHQRLGLFRRTSLADCAYLAASQLQQWRRVYSLCVNKAMKKPRLLPGSDPWKRPGGVTLATERQYSGVTDSYVGVSQSSLLTLKHSNVNSGHTPPKPDPFDTTISKSPNGGDGGGEGKQEGVWQNIVRRTVLRSRRQHSLSINSALVSLADMLKAKDLNSGNARQRAFRQQLLGIGR